MTQFVLQPSMYATGQHKTVFDMLDEVWADTGSDRYTGGNYYLVFGFGRFNGGVPFFERFRKHVSAGGRVTAIVSGSTRANHTSQQLAKALLECGADVHVVNRKQMLHAKIYGHRSPDGAETLVTTSGNFTSPGTKTNIEAAVTLSPAITNEMGFSSVDLLDSFTSSGLDTHTLSEDVSDPAWSLLFDEHSRRRTTVPADTESEEDEEIGAMALLLTLGHSDTARIQAVPGTTQSKGSQYFWLPMEAFGFFPPLDVRNVRGDKATYSTRVNINFSDISRTENVLVTFEAENNKDFRLGTGPLRNSRIAAKGDIAVLTRDNERDYTLRIVREDTAAHTSLLRYALTPVGHRGKLFGYAPASDITAILSS